MLNFTVPGFNTKQRIRFHTDQFSDPFHYLCSDGVLINIRHSKQHKLVKISGVPFVDLDVMIHIVNNKSKRLYPLLLPRQSRVQMRRAYNIRSRQ